MSHKDLGEPKKPLVHTDANSCASGLWEIHGNPVPATSRVDVEVVQLTSSAGQRVCQHIHHITVISCAARNVSIPIAAASPPMIVDHI